MKKDTKTRARRFTVTLPEDVYDRLKAVADGHAPRLSLQYVLEHAVRDFLKKAEDPQVSMSFADPLSGLRSSGDE